MRRPSLRLRLPLTVRRTTSASRSSCPSSCHQQTWHNSRASGMDSVLYPQHRQRDAVGRRIYKVCAGSGQKRETGRGNSVTTVMKFLLWSDDTQPCLCLRLCWTAGCVTNDGCPISARFWQMWDSTAVRRSLSSGDRSCPLHSLGRGFVHPTSREKRARCPDFLYAAPTNGHVCGFH